MSDTTPEFVNTAAKAFETQPAQAAEQPIDRDRRGIVLPARQRVGGIITPQ